MTTTQTDASRSSGVVERVVLGRGSRPRPRRSPPAWKNGASAVYVPLAMNKAPFRDAADPLRSKIRKHTAAGDTIVTVVLPEFVPEHRWQQLLHNQTAFAFRWHSLFEPNVVVTSVPFHIRDEDRG